MAIGIHVGNGRVDSTQCEGAAPAGDLIAQERAGLMPVSGDGNGFATKYAGDFALYKSLGLTHHRLSIEWARIEPAKGERDAEAIGHYRDVLTAADDSGITPWVTLHHFTLPQWFRDEGGFMVEANRTSYWRDHAEFMAEAFGDLVGGWKPVNETNYFASVSTRYFDCPAEDQPVLDTQINLATCEAAVILRQTDKPVCSIYGLSGAIPMDESPEAAQLAADFYEHNWRGVLLHRDGVLHTASGDVIERPDLKDCFDMIGFSYYACAGFVKDQVGPWSVYPADAPVSPLGYGIWADGLRVVLDRLQEVVPNTPHAVVEYGIGTDDDEQRAAYIQRGLEVTNEALGRGQDIRGFFHWTGTDNYEWRFGYDVKFGIIDTDRNVRPSAHVLAKEALG